MFGQSRSLTYAIGTAGLEHVEGDHGVVVEDERVVGLDKAHAAHVRREVVAVVGLLRGLVCDIGVAEIAENELIAELVLFCCCAKGNFSRERGLAEDRHARV